MAVADELVLVAHRQRRVHQVFGPVQGVGRRRCHVGPMCGEQGAARSIINGVCGHIVVCVGHGGIHRAAHADLLNLTRRMQTPDRSSCPGRICLTLTRAIQDAHAVGRFAYPVPPHGRARHVAVTTNSSHFH